MASMDERESASYKEKYVFLRLYDRITAAKENLAFEAQEREIQSVLTDAMLNESLGTQCFVALVVYAYGDGQKN